MILHGFNAYFTAKSNNFIDNGHVPSSDVLCSFNKLISLDGVYYVDRPLLLYFL